MRIKTKIFFSSSVLVLAGVLITMMLVLSILNQGIEDQTEFLVSDLAVATRQHLEKSRDILVDTISTHVLRMEYATATLCQDMVMKEGIINDQLKSLYGRLETICRRSDIDFMVVFDRNGELVASWPGLAGAVARITETHFRTLEPFKRLQYYVNAEDLTAVPILSLYDIWDRSTYRAYNIDMPDKEGVVVVSVGVIPNDYMDEPVGYVMGGITRSKLLKPFERFFSSTGQIAILEHEEMPLVWAGLPGEAGKIADLIKSAEKGQTDSTSPAGPVVRFEPTGNDYFVLRTPFSVFTAQGAGIGGRAAQATVILGEPAHLVYTAENRIREHGANSRSAIQKSAFFATLLVLLLTAFVARIVGKRIAGPVVMAAVMSDKIAAGDLQHRLDDTSSDETGILATSMNILVERLKDLKDQNEHQMKALEKSRETLKNSEQLMVQVIDFLPDPTFVIDQNGIVLFWNRSIEKLTGIAAGSMVGQGNYEYAMPFYGERRPVLLDLILEWDEKHASGYTHLLKEGGTLAAEIQGLAFVLKESWFWAIACPLFDREGKIIGAIETLRNISELKRAEQELRQTSNRFQTLFESASDAILIFKSEEIVDCNQKAMELFGYTAGELCGCNLADLFAEDAAECFQTYTKLLNMPERKAGGAVQVFECIHRHRSGALFDTEVSFSAFELDSEIYHQAIIRDITERKNTQELMIQTEKMMSVGGLAAGMAHEINNPLGIILQSLQNMSRRLGTGLEKNRDVAMELGLDMDVMQEYFRRRSIDLYMENIRDAAERAARIVTSMLNFSRKSGSKRQLQSMNTILDQVLDMVSSDYDLKHTYDFKAISIVRDYGEIPEIKCIETELAQVFLNLIKNAAQAMGKHGCSGESPRLVLKTDEERGYVKIIVEDNGPGIEKKHLRSVFEPFFTTKEQGEGTGLGLSVSYFIITTHHRGTFEVESDVGKGTRFIITLPIE